MQEKFIYILQHAVKEGVSDIHIGPLGKAEYAIRYRKMDKQLMTFMTIEESVAMRLINYIKFISDMSVSNFVAQTGRYTATVKGEDIDLRISSAPSVYAESIVIRIVSKHVQLQLGDLTESVWARAVLKEFCTFTHGLVLISGATGSGKSTTLYALLQILYAQQKNVITIEDPIEHHVLGITQLQLNELAGYEYETIFKQVLRHDPDVVVFGEIRDIVAAQVAMRCAMTGHLVIATIHASSSKIALRRLEEFGIHKNDIDEVVRGVSYQELQVQNGRRQAQYEFCSTTRVSHQFSSKEIGEASFALREESDTYEA